MRLPAIVFLCVVCVPGVASAQDKPIFKCSGNAGTLYSDAPCVAPQPPSMRALQATTPISTQDAAAPLPSAVGDANWGRLSIAPLSSTRIFIGMTDTQVLNLVRYGRPARIARSHDGHTWHEWWTYTYSDSGEPREVLHFANARLVAQEDPQPQPPTSTAALAPSLR